MSLDATWVSVLACPRCKGPLTVASPLSLWERAGVRDCAPSPAPDELHCVTCRLAYPIREDVPELLHEEARPLVPSGR